MIPKVHRAEANLYGGGMSAYVKWTTVEADLGCCLYNGVKTPPTLPIEEHSQQECLIYGRKSCWKGGTREEDNSNDVVMETQR